MATRIVIGAYDQPATHRLDDLVDAFGLDYLNHETAAMCLFGWNHPFRFAFK